VDSPKKTREIALSGGPADEVVERLSDSGDRNRFGDLHPVQGSSPKPRFGDAPPREKEHRGGDVHPEDAVALSRNRLRERAAPAAEIDDETLFQPCASERSQKHRGRSPRDAGEARVVDSGEVLAIEHGQFRALRFA
jgi:hypothetical protein